MIASIVAVIDGQKTDGCRLVATVGHRSEFQMGELRGSQLPLTIEAGNAAELESATEWLLSLPGVLHVNVIYVNFE